MLAAASGVAVCSGVLLIDVALIDSGIASRAAAIGADNWDVPVCKRFGVPCGLNSEETEAEESGAEGTGAEDTRTSDAATTTPAAKVAGLLPRDTPEARNC